MTVADRSSRTFARVAFAVAWLSAVPLAAHGGRYRGAAPAPAAPATPMASGAPFVPVASTTAPTSRDLERWQAWWELNKDPYLEVKARVRAAAARRPGAELSHGTIDTEIVPALSAALRATRQPDLASACLIALGRIGRDPSGQAIRATILGALARGNQELRETAALALGLSRLDGVETDLTQLIRDDRFGRRLYGRESVDLRTRVFAAYGLGLLAERTSDVALRRRVVEVLTTELRDARDKEQELAMAAVHGIRLAAPGVRIRDLASWELTQTAVDSLSAYCERRVGQGQQMLQAHASLAVAQILRGDESGALGKYARLWSKDVAEPAGRSSALTQSSALAFGVLGANAPEDASAALRRLAERGSDRQARSFALIALGQVGGDANRAFLLGQLKTGNKATVRPWAALALGLAVRGAGGAGQRVTDDEVGRALLMALQIVKNDQARGAFALALGLARHTPAAAPLRAMLAEHDKEDELAGYLCLGISLLDDAAAIPQLRELAQRSLRRPALLRQIAAALGRLGDANAGEHLVGLLCGRELNVAALGAVAGALGQLGDASAAAALLAVLRDDHVPDLARAFAAAALGGIADDSALPWYVPLSLDINYRAALPTLSDGRAGVLDIL